MDNDFKALFAFSKKERAAIYILLLISSLVWLIPGLFYRKKISPVSITVTPLELEEKKRILLDRTNQIRKSTYSSIPKIDSLKSKKLFEFDPNYASKAQLIALGLTEKSATTILKYRAKGGRFTNPDDIGKIYGIPEDIIDRIIPFVKINYDFRKDPVIDKQDFSTKNRVHIDLNRADSSDLLSLPGIGVRLSGRIIKYRARLGGFYKIEQLKEVYGISDTLFYFLTQHLTLHAADIRLIKVNEIGYEQLLSHPYVGHIKARLWIAYRNLHGQIKNSEELGRALLMDPVSFEKLIPYCEF